MKSMKIIKYMSNWVVDRGGGGGGSSEVQASSTMLVLSVASLFIISFVLWIILLMPS